MSLAAARPAADLGRIRLIAIACAWLCLALAVLLPVLTVVAWITHTAQTLAMKIDAHGGSAHVFPYGLQTWQRVVGCAISLIPTLVMSWGLWRARRSLTAFARGDFFAGEAVKGLRDFAGAGFWAGVCGLVAPSALSVALTVANPPGQRELTVGLSSSDLIALLTAGIFWVIAAAMARAAEIARENAMFV